MSSSLKSAFNLAKRVIDAPQLVWFLLFLPALPMLEDRYYPELMYESGLLAVQLTVFTLALTPLLYLLKWWPPGQNFMRWLIKRRRYFGVAAFGYSALHTFFYLRYTGSFELVWLDLDEVDLVVGWIAMILMSVLALTSNNVSQRLMGKYWKVVQRTSYCAAAATALHWILINQFLDSLMLWTLPLLGLQCIRLVLQRYRQRARYSQTHRSGNSALH